MASYLYVGRVDQGGNAISQWRTFIAFDLTGAPFLNATIKLARLQLTPYFVSVIDPKISASSIDAPWGEMTITYDNVPATGAWVGPVQPFTSNAFWDITPLVQQWVTGQTANNGVVLEHTALGNNTDALFYSSDAAVPLAKTPALFVQYCGSP